jgi:hypothetical protein
MSVRADDESSWSPQGPSIELSDEHCWNLLRTASVGRLATADPTGPGIFPINFTCDAGTVIFRTAEGSKLTDLTLTPVVAIEADGSTGEGRWSVVVRGPATAISDAARLDLLPFPEWRPVASYVGHVPLSGGVSRHRAGQLF